MSSTGTDWLPRPPRRKPRTLWSDLARLWRGFRGLPRFARLLAIAIAAVVAFSVVSILFKSPSGTNIAARATTTLVRPATTTTTTTPPLPAGDDRTVKSVLDGDSFEVSDGSKVRILGIDAPDTETKACFSADAMAHLSELLAPGSTVRLVYDATRTDKFNRTLAYVYRVPDALFVNVALVRDGYAKEQPVAPNTAHADEIKAAADDASAAHRGLWQACPSTTTSSGARATTTTTRPAGTATTAAAPGTTAAATTTRPATTTTAKPAGSAGAVEPGAACLLPGLTAYFSNGAPAVCATGSDGVSRWKPA